MSELLELFLSSCPHLLQRLSDEYTLAPEKLEQEIYGLNIYKYEIRHENYFHYWIEGNSTNGRFQEHSDVDIVKRPYYAKVRAQDRFGDWYEAEGEELIARCFCHELDHLDGILYTQQMERLLTEEELAELYQ